MFTDNCRHLLLFISGKTNTFGYTNERTGEIILRGMPNGKIQRSKLIKVLMRSIQPYSSQQG